MVLPPFLGGLAMKVGGKSNSQLQNKIRICSVY
jgi:hypothetical protein